MPRKRKVKKRKKTKRTGGGWLKKIGLGVAGLGTAALAASAYKVSQSGAGQWMGRNAANRSRYKVPTHWGSRWN